MNIKEAAIVIGELIAATDLVLTPDQHEALDHLLNNSAALFDTLADHADGLHAAAIAAHEEGDDDTARELDARSGRLMNILNGKPVRSEGAPPYDAATATGMYDGW
jgi:hypothetical protein